jgi:hypothetical protein
MSLILWFCFFCLLIFLLEQLFSPLRKFRFFRVLIAPGMMVTAAGTLLGCVITGTKIQAIKLSLKKGEMIKHEPPRFPILAPFLIAVLPILACTAAFLYSHHLMDSPIHFEGELPRIELSQEALPVLGSTLGSYFAAFLTPEKTFNFASVWTWLFLYLALCFLLAPAPTPKDLKYLMPGIVLLGLLVWSIDYMGVTFGWFSRGWWTRWAYEEHFWRMFSFLIGITLFVLVLSGLLSLLFRLVQLTRKRGKAKPP